MRDVGTPVRKAIFDALNGTITIEGAPIPFVDEKLDRLITETDTWVLLNSQDEQQVPLKSYWAAEVTVTLLVINKRQATISKTVVEDVTNQILQILKPSKIAVGITVPAPFKLSYLDVQTADYQAEQVDATFRIKKQIIIKTRLTHS
jgi:hypothetical protein